MKRGRPPYDDILTPREWEVVELLRQGMTNEEIAAELGISFGGAKYHVGEILSKLGVNSREKAVATVNNRTKAPAFAVPWVWITRVGGASMRTRLALLAAGTATVVLLLFAGQRFITGRESPNPLPGEQAGLALDGGGSATQDGVTLRIHGVSFSANENRTKVTYEVVGRPELGNVARPMGPAILIDASGTSLPTIGGPVTNATRLGTIDFPAIASKPGTISLILPGITIQPDGEQGFAERTEFPGNWQATLDWDGARIVSPVKPIASGPVAFGRGTIRLEAVEQAAIGTIIRGQLDGFTAEAIQTIGACPIASLEDSSGLTIKPLSCRLGFGDGSRSFEVTYPSLSGRVLLTFKLTFGRAPPGSQATTHPDEGAEARFELDISP